MELLYVADVLDEVLRPGWSRLACGTEALHLFKRMEQSRLSSPDALPQLVFRADVMYTVDFFIVLLGLILRSPGSDWYALVFDQSDLNHDPALSNLCQEALEIV